MVEGVYSYLFTLNIKEIILLDRYTRPIMKNIWSRPNIFKTWLEVERAVCQVYSEQGEIPKDAYNTIVDKINFDMEEAVSRIDEIEKECKHDVIAFLTMVAEKVGDESRYIHKGLTSSDVLDTSLSLLMVQAGEVIQSDIEALLSVLKEKSLQYKDLVCMGRSHGIHGEPITMGLKFLTWYDQVVRDKNRFDAALDQMRVGKISGPMGNYVNIEPKIEHRVLEILGLKPAPISTQILQRDIHAQYFNSLAILASSLERFCVEIRHLQRTEVLEVEESFSKGQKGSSAMPHKKNPIGSENISGLARVIRSNALASLENIPLWHERDISHSSVERIIAPDSTGLIDYILVRFTDMVRGLVVYPQNVEENVKKSYHLFFSQTVLIALTEKGMLREDAYKLVQENAMQAWQQKTSFTDLISNDTRVSELINKEELKELFSMEKYTRWVDTIFSRVFGGVR